MKKNKKYLIFSVIILGLLSVNYVYAEGEPSVNSLKPVTTSAPTPTNIKPLNTSKPNLIPSLVQQEIQKMKELKAGTNQISDFNGNRPQNTERPQEVRTTTFNTDKQELGNQVKNRRVEQINRYVRNVVERFRALVARESQIKNRIQTRIEKLEEKGFEMSSAKQLLLEIDFEIVKEQVESLRNDITTTLESHDSETIGDLFKRVKTETLSIKKEARNIHTKLVQTIKTIREEMTKDKEKINETVNE